MFYILSFRLTVWPSLRFSYKGLSFSRFSLVLDTKAKAGKIENLVVVNQSELGASVILLHSFQLVNMAMQQRTRTTPIMKGGTVLPITGSTNSRFL